MTALLLAEAGFSAVDAALSVMDQRLRMGSGPIIVAWLKWHPESAIRRAKGDTSWDKVADRFEKGTDGAVVQNTTPTFALLDKHFLAEGMAVPGRQELFCNSL